MWWVVLAGLGAAHSLSMSSARPGARVLRTAGVRLNYLYADWDESWWEDGLTVCEFVDADGALKLGVYTKYSMLESQPHIRPLCAASEEDGVSSLLCDEGVPAVALSAVQQILDPDYVVPSERQAGGGQGLGNPHGEHGEPCYDLRDSELSDDVVLVVREGRDTERVL